MFDRKNILPVLLMVSLLAWLTISAPFVFGSRQQFTTVLNETNDDIPAEESSEPLNNTTEEKTEEVISGLSEYLHHINELIHMTGKLHRHDCSHNCSAYVAFHGELHCPPPNLFMC